MKGAKGVPERKPNPILSGLAGRSLTRSRVARLRRRGAKGAAQRCPGHHLQGQQEAPAQAPLGRTAGAQLEDCWRRQRHQKSDPLPGNHPKEASDDGAGKGGEEQKDEAAGRQYETKASVPSYSDLMPCHPPSPSSLVLSSSPPLQEDANPSSRRLPRRSCVRRRCPRRARNIAPHLGGQEDAAILNIHPDFTKGGSAGTTKRPERCTPDRRRKPWGPRR
jgi:hypothetical protein